MKAVNVPDVGKVELLGEAPWTVAKIGTSFEILDATGASAKPTVHRSTGGTNSVTKPHQNVIWANASEPKKIVAAFEAAN